MSYASLQSRNLKSLWQEIARGRLTAIDSFWEEIAKNGTPLVESIPGDENDVLVTFLWKADTAIDNVVVIGRFDPDHTYFSPGYFTTNQMVQLPGTNLWYKTYRLCDNLYTAYQLAVNDSCVPLGAEKSLTDRLAEWQPDPFNPHLIQTLGGSTFSILKLPGVPAYPWANVRPDVQRGTISNYHFRSEILNNSRDIWVYTPPRYSKTGGFHGLLILFDGRAYLEIMQIKSRLDNLLDDKLIPPLIVTFIDHIDTSTRSTELTGNPACVHFLAQELMPWLREHYPVSADPAHITIGGSSLGGLAAAHAALHRSDIFGNVLAQSGAFAFEPSLTKDYENLIQRYRGSTRQPLQFHLDVGLLETEPSYGRLSLLEASRQMRDVLQEKGYPVHYREYPGGHDYVYWPDALAEGLIALVGGQGVMN